MKWRSKGKLFIAVVLFLISGCATTVPQGSQQVQKQSLAFKPPQGMSAIYVYRASSLLRGGYLFDIELDYKVFGSIGEKTYIYGNIKPGTHTLKANAPLAQSPAHITFNVKPNEIYFFEASPTFLGMNIDLVDKASGSKRIVEYNLSGDNIFEMKGVNHF